MKIFSVALLLLVSLTAQSQQTATLEQSLTKAKAEHKKVLFFFSGSDWCGPCVKFKKTYINSEDFSAFAASSLIVFNADFPRQKKHALSKEQTAENEKLADKYNPEGKFPLVILLDENGKTLRKWEELPTESVAEFVSKLK